MTFSADYAMSRYAGIAYGVRGPASYAASTSDSVTGAAGLAVLAAFHAVTSDNVMGSDALAVVAVFAQIYAEPVTGSDGIVVVASVNNAFAENITASDVLAILAHFYDETLGQVTAIDARISWIFQPVNIFALESENRDATVFTEKRAGQVHAREAIKVHKENRKEALNAHEPGQVTENRQSVTKTDNRNF